MTTLRLLQFPLLLSFIFFTLTACTSDGTPRIYQQNSSYNYQDTLQNLDIAISEHNYRIIHRSEIGHAIQLRGDDNYPLSIVISFCNITYAKEMMEINSSLINDMPCIVTVREEQETVIIGTKLMLENTDNERENEFARRINRGLKSIIAATIE